MKIFKSVFVLSIVVGGIFGVYTNHVNSQVSDLLLENVEALANGEESQPGNYNVYTQYTDYTMNGVVYKQTKVVNCEVGGSFACSGGNFYRYKKASPPKLFLNLKFRYYHFLKHHELYL